ncbi:MAG: alginate export family protein [Methylophilaceae bacterium]
MKVKQKLISIALLSAMTSLVATLQAEEAASFKEAITEGKFSANLKFRWENVNQDNPLDDANAYTLRTLVGYETKPFHGFSINTQFYGLSPFNDDYNDAKKGDPITSRRSYSVIADPEDYDFHQVYLQWANATNNVKFGRQQMFLDNWRYIGDVRFRQNWAVFNGLSYVNTSLAKTTVTLAHFEQIKQITTKIEDGNFEIANIKYAITPATNLTGYGYFNDWDGTALKAKSDKTFGLRLDGKSKVNDQWSVLYTAEYAKQDDYKDGNKDIDNHYYRIGAGAGYGDWFLRVDQEKLSGNSDGKAFQTQLGTNHLFQGWADLFLSTPDSGIEDTMIIAGGKLLGAKLKAEYHFIDSDRKFNTAGGGTGDKFGKELDLGVYYPFTKQLTGAVEYAKFTEDEKVAGAGRKPTTQKIWVTAMYQF